MMASPISNVARTVSMSAILSSARNPARCIPVRQKMPRHFSTSTPASRGSTPATSASSSASASTSKPITVPQAAGASKSAKGKAAKTPVSSCPAGTTMTGLSILKDQPDPVALPEDQYPDWLWTLLDEKKDLGGADRPAVGDLKSGADFYAEKKRLRATNRSNIKASNYLKTT